MPAAKYTISTSPLCIVVLLLCSIAEILGAQTANDEEKQKITLELEIQSKTGLSPFWPSLAHSYAPIPLLEANTSYSPKFSAQPFPLITSSLVIDPDLRALAAQFSFSRRDERWNEGALLLRVGKSVPGKALLQTLLEKNEWDEAAQKAALSLGWYAAEHENCRGIKTLANRVIKTTSTEYSLASEAYSLHMRCAYQQERFDTVLELAQNWQKRFPRVPLPYGPEYMRVISLYRLGDFEQVVRAVPEMLHTNPQARDRALLQEILADAHFRLDHYAEAATLYAGILAANSTQNRQDSLQSKHAWALYRGGDSAAARRILEQHSPVAPEETVFLRFLLEVEAGNFAAAQRSFEQFTTSADLQERALPLLLLNPELNDRQRQMLVATESSHPEVQPTLEYIRGNLAFAQGEFEQATEHYLTAQAQDPEPLLSTSIGVNATQIAMRTAPAAALGNPWASIIREWEQMTEIPELEEPQGRWLVLRQAQAYHLAYSYFVSRAEPGFQELYPQLDRSAYTRDIRSQLTLMQSAFLAHDDRIAEALDLLAADLANNPTSDSLAYALHLLFLSGEYKRVVRLRQEYPKIENFAIFSLHLRALLSLKQNNAAEQLFTARGSAYLPKSTLLQLELLQAQENYPKIIAIVDAKLNDSLDQNTRLRYLVAQGDALFNLRRFGEADSAYRAAMDSADNLSDTSRLTYNALLAYQLSGAKDYTGRAQRALAQPQTDEIRFLIVQDLGLQLQKDGQHAEEQGLYDEYIATYSYGRNRLRLRLTESFANTGAVQQCFRNAKGAWSGETRAIRVDREIIGARCGLELKQHQWIATNLEKAEAEQLPRSYERRLLLAQAYFAMGRQKEAQAMVEDLPEDKLNPRQRTARQWIQINQLAVEKQWKALLELMGDPQRFRGSPRYTDALRMNSRAHMEQNDTAAAIKGLTRLLYSSSVSTEERNSIRLDLAEQLHKAGSTSDARAFFTKIDPSTLNAENLTRYQTLQNPLTAP